MEAAANGQKKSNGKKKMTYTIYSATKLGPANPQVDSNRH
jgi:hypothetical protein